MRVLLVAGSFPPEHCGVGDYTNKLATALAATPRTKVGVLTTQTAETFRIDGVEVLNKAVTWRFGELFALIRSIKDWAPDILHIQYPSQGFFHRHLPSFLPLICRISGIKVVETWHEPHRMRGLFHFALQLIGTNGLIFVRSNYLTLLPSSFIWLVKRYNFSIIPNAGSLPLSKLSPAEIAELRHKHLEGRKRLIVFFGFIYPSKGIELLFEIGNPLTDRLVIAGAIVDKKYHDQLIDLASASGWKDSVYFTGFLSPEDASDILSAADAVVLPFLDGGGEWNTSIHGAMTQGTLVITTSKSPSGDQVSENLFTAAPNAIEEMRTALNRLAGRRSNPRPTEAQWQQIARAHILFYERQQ